MTKADVALIGGGENAEAKISCKNINSFTSHLEGKVLTVIDASISDRIQREALKSILRNTLWDTSSIVYQWVHDQKDGNSSAFPF